MSCGGQAKVAGAVTTAVTRRELGSKHLKTELYGVASATDNDSECN